MLQHLVSASTEQVHPGAVPSISLVFASETAIPPTIALIIPRPGAGDDPVHLTVTHEAIFPTAAAFEVVLVFTLSFMMGGLLKAHLSPS